MTAGTIRSGWCGIHAGPASHRMCAGSYGGYDCRCDCHRQEDLADPLVEQVMRLIVSPAASDDRARAIIALVRAADK